MMKIQYTFTPLIFFIVLFGGQAGGQKDATGFTPVIDKLSIYARISSAIAIQNKLYSRNSNQNEVMAELLNFPSDAFSDFLKHDFYGTRAQMMKYFDAIKDIGKIDMSGSNELIEMLKVLILMKKNEHFLKPGAVADPWSKLEESSRMAKKNRPGLNFEDRTYFRTGAELLRNISHGQGDQLDMEQLKILMHTLGGRMASCSFLLDKIRDYQTIDDLKEYLEFGPLKYELNAFTTLWYLAVNFGTMFKSTSNFKTDMTNLNHKSVGIKPVISQYHYYEEYVKGLHTTFMSISDNSLMNNAGKRLTIGLEGPDDLKQIENDLNNDWFKERISKDRDIQVLKRGLEPFNQFQSLFGGPSQQWKEILSKFEKIAAIVVRISRSYGSVSRFSNITSVFDKVSTCIQKLEPMKMMPDNNELQKISKFLTAIDENVQDIHSFYGKIKNRYDFEITMNNTLLLKIKLEPIWFNFNSVTNGKVSELLSFVKSQTFLNQLAEFFDRIADDLEASPNLFHSNYKEYEFDSTKIQSIPNIFQDTNAFEVMNCIEKHSIDNMIEALTFFNYISDLETEDKEFKSTSEFIPLLSRLHFDTKKVISETRKQRITKEAIDLFHFRLSGDIPEIAQKIGRGVNSLRAFDQIVREEKSIMEVVSAADSLKDEISRIEGSEYAFSDHIRTSLATTVGDLKKLEKKISNENPTDFNNIFTEASKVRGVQIENSMTYKTIATTLSQNKNEEIKSKSSSFEKIGNLDLNFAKHKSQLEAAPNACTQFEEAAYSFLQPRAKNNGVPTAEEYAALLAGPEWPNWVLVLGYIVIGIGACCCLFCIVFAFAQTALR